ncbi:hypothetical protein CW304_33120 [Bacillus sp. UFRGS-B20]|nr:hypothetical protein CW304_33120 [Bacillus sp. UFRGS-B20]
MNAKSNYRPLAITRDRIVAPGPGGHQPRHDIAVRAHNHPAIALRPAVRTRSCVNTTNGLQRINKNIKDRSTPDGRNTCSYALIVKIGTTHLAP